MPYSNKLVSNADALYSVLSKLARLLSSGDPLSHKTVYEYLQKAYKDETGKKFPTKKYEQDPVQFEDISSAFLMELIDNWAVSLNWELVYIDNPRIYEEMSQIAADIKVAAAVLMENETIGERIVDVEEPSSKSIDSEKAAKCVNAFLNGSWITSLFVKRKGQKTGRQFRFVDSYGEFFIDQNTAMAFVATPSTSSNRLEYFSRKEAFQAWFASQIRSYSNFLQEQFNDEEHEDTKAEDGLLSGVSKLGYQSTEADWAEGLPVNATFTGTNLPGIALRVDPAELTVSEIQSMAIQILELESLSKKTRGFKVIPDSLRFGKGIDVKLASQKIKLNSTKDYSTYDLSIINIDRPAEDLVSQIKTVLSKPESERPKLVSCLFYGVPGSGKSNLANYIGDSLNIPVIKKTYAELQSMYVGEGEKQLSQAFAKAKSEKSILLIDEIDSIAGNRKDADRNYQKTFVNQLLTELDNFEGIFIATCNFLDALDPAVLRRLFLKIKFDFMTEEQSQSCFELYFPKLKRHTLGHIPYLTPGDFYAVKEASQFDTKRTTVTRVREMLKQEIQLKKTTLSEVIRKEKKVGYDL